MLKQELASMRTNTFKLEVDEALLALVKRGYVLKSSIAHFIIYPEETLAKFEEK